MSPNIKYQISTVGDTRLVAYVISVNNGWYTSAHLLTRRQRIVLRKSKELRMRLKKDLERRFWRYIGAA